MSQHLKSKMARQLWIHSQCLTEREPFGAGPAATKAAIEHLGYVQIDTISVIERCHHHILYNRIPKYRREDLFVAQSKEKSVFECWTHALSYVPTRDYPHYVATMKRTAANPGRWFASTKPEDLRKVLRLIKTEGPISIRDIKDDVLVEKDHEWASRKPSKRALQLGFFTGRLMISERQGMLKKYELSQRHFLWDRPPKAAKPVETLEFLLERGLRSQGFVSLHSLSSNTDTRKNLAKLIERKIRTQELLEIRVEGYEKDPHWIVPATWEMAQSAKLPENSQTHILSPFDPLVIQRKRLLGVFGYNHKFEAYIPPQQRTYGYFALPVLHGDEIVAVLDLKTDRVRGRLLVQKWTWLPKQKTTLRKTAIENELNRFEKFQLEHP